MGWKTKALLLFEEYIDKHLGGMKESDWTLIWETGPPLHPPGFLDGPRDGDQCYLVAHIV